MNFFRLRPNMLGLVLGVAGSVALACTLHPPAHQASEAKSARVSKAVTPLWIGPAFSGSWYNPSRSGEGIIVQVLDNGSVIAIWFTFPPEGSTAKQAWILAQGGVIDGSRVRFNQAFTVRGPRFGPGFDPAARVMENWGTLELNFSDCNNAQFSYAGPAQWGSGTRAIQRLTSIDELGCNYKQRLTANGARSLAGLRQRSAAWYDPAHSGEGWFIEELPSGNAVNYWFTYDENGDQAWFVGVGEQSGPRIDVAFSVRPVGTHFGDDFDASEINRQPWGSYTLTFDDCSGGRLDYASSIAAFGSGSLLPRRLTHLAGAVCLDGEPRAPVGGSWSAGTEMPGPQSEMATATMNGRFYVAGGFGGPRAFKRYDPAANTWTQLADTPGGRDHALAAAVDGVLYLSGGNARGDGDQTNRGWRYIEAEDRWEVVTALPPYIASGATTLNGNAYFADSSGDIVQFDARLGRSRILFAHTQGPERDHSQLAAFMGELWMLGGRGDAGETNRVSIFDPASETWREGPAMSVTRGGFAAATTPTQLIVAGGEVVVSGLRVRNQVEAIAAGQNTWTSLPSLPVAVHGVGGATSGNAFYTLGGSTAAGGVSNGGEVQVYRWTP
jgi:hypothetical protein